VSLFRLRRDQCSWIPAFAGMTFVHSLVPRLFEFVRSFPGSAWERLCVTVPAAPGSVLLDPGFRRDDVCTFPRSQALPGNAYVSLFRLRRDECPWIPAFAGMTFGVTGVDCERRSTSDERRRCM
jgi:hypothetical protein